MKTSSRIRNLRREIVNIYNLPEEVQEKFIIIAEHVEELEDQVKSHGVSHHVSVFSEKRMWDIDGKLVVGSPVTDDEIEYYNRFFDEMVSEMQYNSDHWTHHTSKVSN